MQLRSENSLNRRDELSSLSTQHAQLENMVLSLEQTLRAIQAHRQEAEDERMEIEQQIKQQEGNVQAVVGDDAHATHAVIYYLSRVSH